MKRKEFERLQQKARDGKMPDNLNPALLFGGIDTKLLSQIAKGKLDAQEIAKRTLEARGLDIDGDWKGTNSVIK